MGRPKKQEPASTAEQSTKLLVIIPGSQTTTRSFFQLTDPETGQRLSTSECDSALYAKAELFSNNLTVKSLLESRHGKIEIKFIDETEHSFEQLMELENEFYSQGGISDEEAPADSDPEPSAPADEISTDLQAAQLADDEQKEGATDEQ